MVTQIFCFSFSSIHFSIFSCTCIRLFNTSSLLKRKIINRQGFCHSDPPKAERNLILIITQAFSNDERKAQLLKRLRFLPAGRVSRSLSDAYRDFATFEMTNKIIVSPEVLYVGLFHLDKLQILLHLPLSRLRRDVPLKEGETKLMLNLSLSPEA